MKPPTLKDRLESWRHELRYGPSEAWNGWRAATNQKARRKKLLRWLDSLRSHPPEVLMGANIGRGNGVRHHMEGVRDYSSLSVYLAPPDELLEHISYHDLHTTFRDDVMAFEPRGIGVIHSHVYPYFVRWCRRHRESGARWVHTYHSPYFPVPGQASIPQWQEEINDVLIHDARHAHARLSVSRWQQAYLKAEHDIDTTYVPNGVDVLACDRADPSRVHAKIGETPFVLYVGRNDPVKNPADFVRLAARLPDHRFVMIGHQLTRETMIDTWGENPTRNVTFTGAMPRDELQDALAACAVLVVTSVREGLPTLVLEAMAHERPIVVPDDEGCVEAISGGEFGFVYKPSDIDDLVGKTRAALAAGRQPGAREEILARYDWRVIAPRLDAIYRGAEP